uniref:Family with sequence similarity 170 member A n=1 Tax=Pipistrellus kuhlii TaxID=59472 RepID=A0A7J8B1R0_PIPKU|nr:hypothetical protein mPipKuh1_007793 [Pipistrellus kuhlii]
MIGVLTGVGPVEFGSCAISRHEKVGPWNTQDDATLPKSTGETAACSQTPRAKSAISEPFICDFSQSKRPRLDEDAKLDSPEDALQRSHKAVAITQPETESKASSSDSVIFISSTDKGNGAENHISQDNVLQPDSTVEDPACNFPAAEHSGFSEHLIGFSTIIKRPRLDEDAKLDSPEDALQRSHKAVAIIQPETESKASSSDSVIFISSTDKGNGAEHRISQDNVPQPDSPVEAPSCSHPVGEKSGFSEHLIGVSTPIKRPRLDEDDKEYTEIKEMPVSQVSGQTKNSSDYPDTEIPSRALSYNEPVMSPVPGTEQRLMRIYYMHVQLKRGVAVLYHTKEGWVPPSKKIKMEEMFYIGKVHKNVPVSHMPVEKHLIAPEPMLDSRAQEKRGEADSPPQPPAQSRYPRAKTPEWLVAQKSGFRCMACCRVFPSLEVLQEHVECGVREGFSCHVYHNAMAHLKYKERQRKKKEKRIRQRLDARRRNI